jgi:outer membrane protein assembly factor BamB
MANLFLRSIAVGALLLAAGSIGPQAHAAGASVTGSDWLSYHGNPTHTGYSSAIPPSGTLSVAWRRTLDGSVQASPLVLGGLVFGATENNTIYALSRRTGATAWVHHLGSPVRRSALPCGNIDPLGITGTPVIDPSTGRLFLVSTSPNGSSIRHTLWGFNAKTGGVVSKVVIDAPGQDPVVENQRGALNVSAGRVFVTFGGHAGDCGNYHGWLNSMTTSGRDLRYFRTGDDREAGMWQPSGPMRDRVGYLFTVTGNGSRTSGSWDGGNAVFKIDPTTNRRVSFFAPSDWATGNANDTDLGSAGAALISSYIYAQGKNGTGYLLNAANLGGIGHPRQTLQSGCAAQFGGSAIHGSSLFLPCTDGVRQLVLSSNGLLHLGWKAASSITGSPVVGGGAVWSLSPSSGTLYALSEASGRVRASIAVGSVVRFATPALSGNLAIVPTTTGITAVAGA